MEAVELMKRRQLLVMGVPRNEVEKYKSEVDSKFRQQREDVEAEWTAFREGFVGTAEEIYEGKRWDIGHWSKRSGSLLGVWEIQRHHINEPSPEIDGKDTGC